MSLALAPFLRIWSEGGRRLLQPGCHPRCLRSIKSGLAQLRAAVKTASHAQPKIVGILAIADMGEWFDTFGPSATRPLADHFAGMDVTLLDWPPQLPEDRTDGIFVTLVPGETLGGWLTAEPQELLQ